MPALSPRAEDTTANKALAPEGLIFECEETADRWRAQIPVQVRQGESEADLTKLREPVTWKLMLIVLVSVFLAG